MLYGLCIQANRGFYSLTLSDALAEYAVEHHEVLPQNMQEFVEWYKLKEPGVNWSAKSLSTDCDVTWGNSVSNLTWDCWENPPTIIIFKAEYLKEDQGFANRKLIERLTEHRRNANKPLDATR
jgi:hypothetical protein